MHRAFENVLARLADGGLLIIAIYNRTATSAFWRHYKRIYNLLGEPLRTIMVLGVFLPRALVRLLRGRHPLQGDRGMNIWYDARDWAGGYPYEYASADEIVEHFAARGLTLKLLKPTRLTGCNEFTFEKSSDPLPAS